MKHTFKTGDFIDYDGKRWCIKSIGESWCTLINLNPLDRTLETRLSESHFEEAVKKFVFVDKSMVDMSTLVPPKPMEDNEKNAENALNAKLEALKRKYAVERDCMTLEVERKYVADLYDLYESEEFSSVFRANGGDFADYHNEPYKILGRADEKNNSLSNLPMWDIQFENGGLIRAYPDEIVLGAIIVNHGETRPRGKKYAELLK